MLVEAGSGHSAGPLGMADIFTALYFHVMVHDPKSRTGKIATVSFSPTATSAQSVM